MKIDSTPLDLMVLYPDGGTGRVDLTAAANVATRIPVDLPTESVDPGSGAADQSSSIF